MIRGRWVVCVVFLWLSYVLFFPQFVSASSVSMSAHVPLSPVWQQAIEEHSSHELDLKKFRNIARLSLQIKGIKNTPVSDESIQILLFKNNQLVDIQENQTSETGETQFTLIYSRENSYRIIILDREHEVPFVIKTVMFNT